MTTDCEKQSPFPETRWSLIAKVATEKSTIQLNALNDLMKIYYPVLRKHLMSNMSLSVELAEDLLHSFIHEKILETQLLLQSSKERGRFRSFLLKCLTNYVYDYFRKHKKTTSKQTHIDHEFLDLFESKQPQLQDAFDLLWTQQIIAEIVRLMKLECKSKQRTDLWLVFKGRLLDPILENTTPMSYDDIMSQFDLESPSQAMNLLITAKRMFKRIFQEVVADTVTEYSDIEQEIINLKKILQNSAGLHS